MVERLLGANRRLVLLVAILLVAGFLATSLASYFVSKASVREGIVESGLPLTADNIYSEIQKDLLRPIFIASMMANDTFLRDWVLDGERDPASIAKYLSEIKSKYDTVASFFASERTRNYYFPGAVLKQIDETNWRDVWYFRVRQMAEPYEINVDPDFANNDAMTIFINYRLLDYDGKFLGATGVGLTVTSLRHQIDAYRERFQRDVYFVDTMGNIVLAGASSPLSRMDSVDALPTLAAIVPGILAGGAGSFEYQRDGRTVLLSTRFIPELGWHVFVEQDETTAIAGIRHALIVNLLICLLITVVVVAAISYTIRIFQARIEQMAITDKLTGLLNRHGFEALFTQALKESKRTRDKLSVVLFDIDRFKEINDRLGHLAGDAVLQRVGAVAHEVLRESDAICRWGGDEFLVMLKACGLDDALKLAAKLGERMKTNELTYDGNPIAISVSLGVAQHHIGEDADGLIGRVDGALYQAKSLGRQRVAHAV
jgi:diguanylate cyclase (GGDEF)-like protein